MGVRFKVFPDDLDAVVDFYVRVLGFRLVLDQRGEPGEYVAFERDGLRIGAARRGEGVREWRRPPSGVEVVLEVDDVAGQLLRVVAAGWPIDPAGYYLRVTNRGPAA